MPTTKMLSVISDTSSPSVLFALYKKSCYFMSILTLAASNLVRDR